MLRPKRIVGLDWLERDLRGARFEVLLHPGLDRFLVTDGDERIDECVRGPDLEVGVREAKPAEVV